MNSHLGLNGSWAVVSCLGLSSTDGPELPSLFHLRAVGTGQRTPGKDLHPQLSQPHVCSQGAEQGWGHLCTWGRPGLETRTVWQFPSQPQLRTARGGLTSPPDAGSQLGVWQTKLVGFFPPSCFHPCKHRW